MKLQRTAAFSDSICDLRTRKIKATFFSQINILILGSNFKNNRQGLFQG
ncbi:hypothetical protein [Flavicella sp.]